MKKSVKYIKTVYLPKCDRCNSNILEAEEYYFVAIEGNELTDVRIVHKDCFFLNQIELTEGEDFIYIESDEEHRGGRPGFRNVGKITAFDLMLQNLKPSRKNEGEVEE